MLGQIVEKQVKAVAPMMVPNKGGFPPMARHVKPQGAVRVTPATALQEPPVLTSSTNRYVDFTHKDTGASSAGNEDVSADALNDNTAAVLAMTDHERAQAIEEIQSFLSPKSIAYLQKAACSGHQPVVVSTPSIWSRSPLAVQQDAPEEPSSTWLKQQTLETELRPIVDVHTNAAMISERFDLNGRRIVDRAYSSIAAKVQQNITASGLFAAQLESSPKELVESIASTLQTIAVEAISPLSDPAQGSPFFVPLATALATAAHQPQDELKHHQYEQGAPGYNMIEISEVLNKCMCW